MQITKNAPIEMLLKAISENLEKRANQVKLSRLDLAKLSDLNRNTVGSALSGSDMKLSTLIRLSRALGYTDWLEPLIETPTSTPMEQLAKKGKKASKLHRVKDGRLLSKSKPASQILGRKKGES